MLKPSGYTFKLMKALKKLKVRFIPEFSDGYKHVDIRIPGAKLDIEVDGIQHLTNPQQILTDFKRTTYSKMDGFDTIHIHNMDLKEETDSIAKAISEVVTIREGKDSYSLLKKEIIFDGNNFSNEEQFDHEYKRVLTKDVEWVKCGEYVNLDSFNDFLRGGFGVIEYDEPYKINWLNSEKSKIDLGYSEQVKHWENILISCHPTAVEYVKKKIDDAKNNIGQTLFDEIVEIIKDRDSKQIELVLK